ncbi:MAG: HD domain-containing protein [Candidatus Brocadiaceae bacterium]|nr:HD domain-containing protein [Candidatus Brocadiaceae bacterium]
MDIDALEAGQLITDEVFLVAEARLQVDRRGQQYYTLTLNAEGGRPIEAKVWSDSIGAAIEAGRGLEVLARIDEFRGKKQLNVQRYKVLDAADYDLSAFVRTADIDADAAFETLFDWEREGYVDPLLKRLMAEFHGNAAFAAEFKTCPAASHNHHNYAGGLIEHTLEVWRLAEAILGAGVGAFDREMVLCAAALHDVGKVRSYRLVAGISQRTEVGELLDHIFVSASMVSNVWDAAVRPEVPAERQEAAARRKGLLLHAVLSHHGKREWGAPVVPRTPEAVLVHYCDVISSTMRMCFDALGNAPEGEPWTDNVYIMDQARRLFVPRDPV